MTDHERPKDHRPADHRTPKQILTDAGVDLDLLDARREAALGATPPVLAAAQTAIDNLRTPGVEVRVRGLQAALAQLVALDPVSAVIVAAAVWVDRYGTSGTTARLLDLQDAVDGLGGPTREERGLEALFAAVERPYDNPADC